MKTWVERFNADLEALKEKILLKAAENGENILSDLDKPYMAIEILPSASGSTTPNQALTLYEILKRIRGIPDNLDLAGCLLQDGPSQFVVEAAFRENGVPSMANDSEYTSLEEASQNEAVVMRYGFSTSNQNEAVAVVPPNARSISTTELTAPEPPPTDRKGKGKALPKQQPAPRPPPPRPPITHTLQPSPLTSRFKWINRPCNDVLHGYSSTEDAAILAYIADAKYHSQSELPENEIARALLFNPWPTRGSVVLYCAANGLAPHYKSNAAVQQAIAQGNVPTLKLTRRRILELVVFRSSFWVSNKVTPRLHRTHMRTKEENEQYLKIKAAKNGGGLDTVLYSGGMSVVGTKDGGKANGTSSGSSGGSSAR